MSKLFRKRSWGDPIVSDAENYGGPPSRSPEAMWGGGVGAPVAMAIYGLACCISRSGTLRSEDGALALSGSVAVAFGIAWISGAAFLHFHYLWGNVQRLALFSNLGKFLSAIVLLGSLVYLIWGFFFKM